MRETSRRFNINQDRTIERAIAERSTPLIVYATRRERMRGEKLREGLILIRTVPLKGQCLNESISRENLRIQRRSADESCRLLLRRTMRINGVRLTKSDSSSRSLAGCLGERKVKDHGRRCRLVVAVFLPLRCLRKISLLEILQIVRLTCQNLLRFSGHKISFHLFFLIFILYEKSNK